MARTIRGVAEAPDKSTSQNLDAISQAIGDIPDLPFTEQRKLVVTFTSSALDQTIAHGLSGRHSWVQAALPNVGVALLYSPPLASDSKLIDTHFRIVSSIPCVVTVLVCR